MQEARGQDALHRSSSFFLACVFQLGFQLVGLVEMVFDGALLRPVMNQS